MENLYDYDSDLIDKFLTGQLTPDEKSAFDQKTTDPAFRRELAARQAVADAIERQENARLKNMLREEETNIRQKKQQKTPVTLTPVARPPLWKRIAAVAALFLVFGAIWWLLQKPAPSDLFATYFDPPRNTLSQQDRSPAAASTLQDAFVFYENKKYEKALTAFESYLRINPGDNDVAFYQACTLLQLGRSQEAIPIFLRIIQSGKTAYIDDAKWYLALAYIHKQDFENARPLLESLQKNPFYNEKASDALKELNKK